VVARILEEAFQLIRGEPAAPRAARLERHFRLIGVCGIVDMALAGLDVACWDALAIAAALPMASFLGGAPKPVPAYNSNGLSLMAPDAAADEAEQLLSTGFAP